MNFRYRDDGTINVALDETTTLADVEAIVKVVRGGNQRHREVRFFAEGLVLDYPRALARTSTFLTHPVFNTHHSENADDALHPLAWSARTSASIRR